MGALEELTEKLDQAERTVLDHFQFLFSEVECFSEAIFWVNWIDSKFVAWKLIRITVWYTRVHKETNFTMITKNKR